LQLAGGKVIFLLRLVLLARLLTPDDFGLVAIATSATGFLLAVTDFGMIPALVQRKDVDLCPL
jgi:lipopolysaccharide exporter